MSDPVPPAPTAPVVVTFREVKKILTGPEAVGELQNAANTDPEATPLQKATAMAALGDILKKLETAERKAGAVVLTTAQDGKASRLQSMIAAGEQGTLRLEPLPTGGLEAKFDTLDWGGWATVAWAKLTHVRKHPMMRPTSTTPESIPDVARVGIVGDWGTGMYGAPEIAKVIKSDPDPFAVLMHLGDVYYSGTKREMKQRFLDIWPMRKDAVHRGLNSNHDMYSGGEPYFEQTLPAFGQTSSYFAMQNKHFTLIGLDVAYIDHAIDDKQVEWAEQVIAQTGDRKVIFFSHHQLYSHFESQGAKLWGHPGFNKILKSKRVFAWYWGHEHRCTIFQKPDPQFNLLARCVGHGGMPQARGETIGLPKETGTLFAKADWRRSNSVEREGNVLPDCVVLEGENPLILGEEEKFTPHGYAVLMLDGKTLKEEVRDAGGKVIYEQVIA